MKIIRHPWAPRAGVASLFGLGLALGVLAGASCKVESVFTCLTSEDCVAEGGEGGVCEPNSLCTFPDMACPSGKRWHDRAAELAGKCYDPADLGGETDSVAGTDTEATAGTAGSSGSEGGSSSEGGGSTTLPADDSSPGPPPATDGSSSSGGMAATCDEIFGTAAGYVLCEDNADNCSFNVMLGMTSCDALCMSFGSTCIEGFTNSATGCVTDGALACDDATTTESVCRCAKP
jgi:hypothetical protein